MSRINLRNDNIMEKKTERMIQEYVPGKQVTMAHIIAKPDKNIYRTLGLEDNEDAIGILTITPSEASIIAGDVSVKVADVEIGFLDRFSGSLVILGDVTSVETAIKEILSILVETLEFTISKITRS